jgi:hypothetical protein
MKTTLPLWEIDEVREEAAQRNASNHIIIIAIIAVLFGFITLPKYQLIGTTIILISFIPTIIAINRIRQINSIKYILEIIGVDEGHPWHPADEGESAKTKVMNDLGQWITLPYSAQISLHSNPITHGWSIRDEDDENLLNLGSNISPNSAQKMELYVNQALILSRAQEFEDDPTLKDARKREDVGEGLLEREWLDTSPGQVEIEFGQMSRAREILGKKRNSSFSPAESEE